MLEDVLKYQNNPSKYYTYNDCASLDRATQMVFRFYNSFNYQRIFEKLNKILINCGTVNPIFKKTKTE